VHAKRGAEAMNDFGILPRCKTGSSTTIGKPISPTRTACTPCATASPAGTEIPAEDHQECWAKEMKPLFARLPGAAQEPGVLDERQFKRTRRHTAPFSKRLGAVIRAKDGRAQGKAANLLDRLEDFELMCWPSRFLKRLPFTNNGAEGISAWRNQAKISAASAPLHERRSLPHSQLHLHLRKRGRNILEELQKAILGKPYMPWAFPAGP